MSDKKINTIAARVIELEASALNQMSKKLPNDFPNVVNAILNTKGRVIVSGVGKSGHIGKKIAATLASTGTNSSFVHATEASHGDLGMITSQDFCLVISNSGETSELQDIVAHTRRFGIPMAVVSSKAESTLAKSADYKLILVEAPEACAIGMAPTTSTTLTLALGDALAVALMESRDFRPEDFNIFHPGGKLGSQMFKVEQLMRPISEMAIMPINSSMKDIVLRMTESGYGVAVLVDEGGFVNAVISDGDLRRHAVKLFDQDPKKIATLSPVVVSPLDLIGSALKKMQTKKVYTILVTQKNKPVGLLRMHDMLRAGIA